MSKGAGKKEDQTMGVTECRQGTCDRCGKEVAGLEGTKNHYNYSRVEVQGFDSRSECRPFSFDLCGDCLADMGKWLKEKFPKPEGDKSKSGAEKGEWVNLLDLNVSFYPPSEKLVHYVTCSNCYKGRGLKTAWRKREAAKMDFCPNCGANMRGGEDDDST